MFSMLSITPSAATGHLAASTSPDIVISIGVGVASWLVATFVIARITKRVAAGSTLLQEAALQVGCPGHPRTGP